MFEFGWKNLITNSWILARYGDWRNAWDIKSAKTLGRNILHCGKCGLYRTYPIDILGETVTIYKDKQIIDYCINCAGKIYNGEVWDCTTGEKVIIDKIDNYHIIKYKLKLVLLWIWIILRFVYKVPYQILMWKVVLPIRKYFYKRKNAKV